MPDRGDNAQIIPSRPVRAASIWVAVALAAVILVQLANVLLLLFAAVLLAVGLDGLAMLVSERSSLSRTWALVAVCLALVLVGTLFALLAGPPIAGQITELSERLPVAFGRLREALMEYGWFRALWVEQPDLRRILGSGAGLLGRVTGLFTTALGAITSVFLVVVLGVYAAAQPEVYLNGVVRLVAPPRRTRAGEVLAALGQGLRWWLVARFASMVVIGILTGLGLLAIGLPLAFSLGLLAGILTFIPFIGPVLSAVPTLIIALVESPVLAGWVGAIYLGVQLLESNLITPLIEKRAVHVPPVITIGGEVIMAVLFGLVGVILSTPLIVVGVLLIQTLYIEDVLGDQVALLGEH